MPKTHGNDVLDAILRESRALVDAVRPQWVWAEDEVTSAIKRHPAQRDLLDRSFGLLGPTHPLMRRNEALFRSHCRELLERVASGADTRPGTAAEVCCACHDVSLLTPLSSSATGLYFRMWGLVFPDRSDFTDLSQYHEALEHDSIDRLEALARRRLASSDRVLGKTSQGR